MAYLAVDKNGTEVIFISEPQRGDDNDQWMTVDKGNTRFCNLETGTIKELIGKNLTWSDEPVEI